MRRFGFPRTSLRRVRVSGRSMEPTYRDGDVLLVRWFSRVEPELALGSVVVIERDVMPGVFFIKRIQKSHSGAYWIEGDNRDQSLTELMQDSRKWGYIPAHEVKARVIVRLRRG